MERLVYRLFDIIGRIIMSRAFLRFWIIIGMICVFLAIFFGLPLLGYPFWAKTWVRLGIIGLILAPILIYYIVRFIRNRRKARDLEDALIPEPVGDGDVLNTRFEEALDKLKKTGGKNYLYELPWYVIIGPPGAGKTTALRYSGIEFPGQDLMPDHGQGFGGTKNVDWWFAEDAVLIDTAGRYVMQESDKEADEASWTAFLDLLKKGRPDQPINGVILAFSVEDMLNATEESLAHHATTVRERLGEIHKQCRIDFPVYVLFTKADLIAGFREYFSSFSQRRRELVWGHTFQTKDRRAQTHAQVGEEFDALVQRLSDEVVDRMAEEPDATSRIAIFGLPGQMAMMRDNVNEFLRRVFEPTRYDTSAILRGFYFTSGTQEGTPIDQVLGAMARDGEGEGFQPAFMSGKGKSYFLHDLLTKVIFAERDWVNFDRRAVRRRSILRTLALSVIGLSTTAAMAAFGYSYWMNDQLVRNAEAHARVYNDNATNELNRTVISTPELTGVITHLDTLRNLPGGYGNPLEPTFWEGLGLSRHASIEISARKAYSDGLERMLRPRMMLHLENDIHQLVADGDTEGTYSALKIYMLLGHDPEAQGNGDEAIKKYFQQLWLETMPGATKFNERQALNEHLAAMLEMDGDQVVLIRPTDHTKLKAREAIVDLPLDEQAFAAIMDNAAVSGVPDFNLVERVSGRVNDVFTTVDGTPLESLGVPGIYTFEGYWGFFVDEVLQAEQRLRDEQWVLGETAVRVDYEQQLANLENRLVNNYRHEFTEAWKGMLANLKLQRMSTDHPEYTRLGYLSSRSNSPMAQLVKAVSDETNLIRLYDELATLSDTDIVEIAAGNGSLGEALGNAFYDRTYSQSGVFTRVILSYFESKAKIPGRPSTASGGVDQDVDRRRVQNITDEFRDWHAMVEGTFGDRLIDHLVKTYEDLHTNRIQAGLAQTEADRTMLVAALTSLIRSSSGAPQEIADMNNAINVEFRTESENATIADLNRALNREITQFCTEEIAPFFPFRAGSSTHVPIPAFGEFFGHGGLMDQFFTTHLRDHVVPTSDGLRANTSDPIGQRLSTFAVKQFDNAEQIRRAFFPPGSQTPQLNMSFQYLKSTPPNGIVAFVTVHGTSMRMSPGDAPESFAWPGDSFGWDVRVVHGTGQEAFDRVSQGRWDIGKVIMDGRNKVNGNVVDTTRTFDGVSITYRIEFDSRTVPFLMRELRDFKCPNAMD